LDGEGFIESVRGGAGGGGAGFISPGGTVTSGQSGESTPNIVLYPSGNGGRGGNPGQPGQPGQAGKWWDQQQGNLPDIPGGAGGAAGAAVDGESFITWVNVGTIIGQRVN